MVSLLLLYSWEEGTPRLQACAPRSTPGSLLPEQGTKQRDQDECGHRERPNHGRGMAAAQDPSPGPRVDAPRPEISLPRLLD